MKRPKGFFTYFHHADVIALLSDAQAGRLYKALMNYGETGEVVDFDPDPTLNMAYTLLKKEIDINFEHYNNVCTAKQEASKIREREKREAREITKNNAQNSSIYGITHEEADEFEEMIRRRNAHIYED